VGLFDFLRKSDERAMPDPGTPEFDAMVAGSAIPDSQSVSMGEEGWTRPGTSQTFDLRGTDQSEQIKEVLRAHGIDPDQQGQTVDASQFPGLREALLKALFQIPSSEETSGGASAKGDDGAAGDSPTHGGG
jgi:hypothetical protein